MFVHSLFKGHYYTRNMTFDDHNFPPIVPAADIYIDLQVYTYINGEIQNLEYYRPYLEVKTKGIFYFKWLARWDCLILNFKLHEL